jgi:hypothetical protein
MVPTACRPAAVRCNPGATATVRRAHATRLGLGETIAHVVAPTRYPYQVAGGYAKWAADPNTSPIDANLLVVLIAPRALLLQTGEHRFRSEGRVPRRTCRAAGVRAVREARPAERRVPARGTDRRRHARVLHARGRARHGGDWAVHRGFSRGSLEPSVRLDKPLVALRLSSERSLQAATARHAKCAKPVGFGHRAA